jgi:hypothetical protein
VFPKRKLDKDLLDEIINEKFQEIGKMQRIKKSMSPRHNTREKL